MDIEKLLLREDNKFDFVNEVAAEATSYIEANRDEYGFKKPILHALSNRMKEAGFDRPEAYMETDPYKPDPSYLRDLEIQYVVVAGVLFVDVACIVSIQMLEYLARLLFDVGIS